MSRRAASVWIIWCMAGGVTRKNRLEIRFSRRPAVNLGVVVDEREILALLRRERLRLVTHGVSRLIVLVRQRVFDCWVPFLPRQSEGYAFAPAVDRLRRTRSEGTPSSRHNTGRVDHPRAATAGGYDSQTS